MRKLKFIIPVLVLLVAVVFAFGNRKPTPTNSEIMKVKEVGLATTYFVFTGTTVPDYTDATKWIRYTTDPEEDCNNGNTLVCQIHSGSIATIGALVSYISTNGINGPELIEDSRKNP
ncbi:MAG: hypothetical protein KIT80_01575 [Chitinophagaceae bacterium]|nr:hypothetical protein [Chitinophagaceae bacterium]MCW5925576.1 hypothetical protein [Chitinophagaceae bacterium]